MYENVFSQQQQGQGYNPNVYPQFAQPVYPQPGQPPMYNNYGGGIVNGLQLNPFSMKAVSTLSKDEQDLLLNSGEKPFAITPVMIAKAKCNHKDNNGAFTIDDLGNNRYHCSICDSTFDMIETDYEAICEATKLIVDIFQTIKTQWVNPPKDYVDSVYQIIALINQVPEMWKAAKNDWKRISNQLNNQVKPAYVGGYGTNYLNNYPVINQNANFGFSAPPMYDPNAQYYQPQVGQPMGMGYYPQQQQPVPVGGLVPNGSAFYQQPQQPQQPPQQNNNIPAPNISIPMPGTPQKPTTGEDNNKGVVNGTFKM